MPNRPLLYVTILSGISDLICRTGTTGAGRCNSRNRFTVHFDPVDSRTATRPVAGAPHQVGEANLLHAAKVWIIHPVAVATFDDIFDVQTPPAHVNELDFRFHPIGGEAGALVADEPRSVGELHNRMKVMKPADPGAPADRRHSG